MIKLYLSEENKEKYSPMQISLMEDEVKEFNEKYPLNQGEIDVKIVYLIGTDDGAEASVYIRNTSPISINFEGIPIHIVKNDAVIGIKVCDFKEVGTVPSNSAAPYIIKFSKDQVYYPNEIEGANVRFGVDLEFQVDETLDVKIDNLPENLDYDQNKFIEEFLNELNKLRVDTHDINLMTMAKDENLGGLNAIILVRNGHSHDIEIATLPITLYSPTNILLYKGEFNARNIIVKAQTAHIFNMNLPKALIPIDREDYEEFKLEFN